MKPKSQERGQVLILIVFAAVGIFAFSALAIDGSRVFSDRRHAQNAADTSVLAAALAKIRGDNYEDAATQRALSNGFDSSGVEVKLCSDPSITLPCEGLPAGAEKSEYIQVIIRANTQTTFARILGRDNVESVVTAVARVQGSSSTTTSLTDAAIFSTKGGQEPQCLAVLGGGVVYTHGSGVFVNCETPNAIFINGGGSLEMDAIGQVVGCNDSNSSQAYFDPIQCAANGGHSLPIGPSDFAGYPTTQAPPACSGPARSGPVNGVFEPGTYNFININATYTMNPGVYCINGPFSIGSTLNAPNGSVQLVFLQDQSIIFGGHATMDFADLEIYGNKVDLSLTSSNAAFRADRLRYFSTGSGTIRVTSSGEFTSGNAYFYLAQGDLALNGQANITLHAPPQGDPFGGLLVHKPWDNHTALGLNGGANVDMTGTFLAPGSDITYNGTVNFVLHSQIIGSTFKVNGSGNLDIFYDPSQNFQPPNSPVIQLTK